MRARAASSRSSTRSAAPSTTSSASALDNAREALARRLGESASQRRLLEGLARLLDLEAAPERIEVYDNSHIGGTDAIGAMIVAGPEGLMKNAYRKFSIRNEAGAPPATTMR